MTSSEDSSSVELSTLIRKNLLRAGGMLLLLAGIAAVLMTQFRQELDEVTQAVFDQVGLAGLTLLIFITDCFVSPFPPDTVLILISASEYHQLWGLVIPMLGVVSTVAGIIGFLLGRYFSNKKWAERLFGQARVRSKTLILKFGGWAVALGALTPIPFSITCWTAGLMHLPLAQVWKPCLLRIPRYIIYYAAIAYFPQLFT